MSAPMLFGKLPACGDFVSRGLAGAERAWWDERLSVGTAQARALLREGWDAAWDAAPHWCFDLRHGGNLSGAIALSRDRAGRRFPLVLAVRRTGAAAGCVAALARGLFIGLDADAMIASVAGVRGEAAAAQRGWWPACDPDAAVRDDDPARIVPAMLAAATAAAA